MGFTKITIQAAAEILGVSPQTLRAWDRNGTLRAERDPKTGYRLYRVGQLEQFADRKKLKRNRPLAKLAS